MANTQNLVKRTKERVPSQLEEDGLLKEVILTRRTTKVVKGGKKTSFSAMVAVGDKKGHIGVAIGKAPDVRNAVEKAIKKAKKNMISVNLFKNTITHDVDVKFGASHILLKPAKKGRGMISSNVIRTLLELAGVKDVVAKMHGTSNKITNTYCIMKALKELKPARVSKVVNAEAQKDASINGNVPATSNDKPKTAASAK
ncbi:MAG: 30S ribosomal protein S5 [bacterium]